MPNGDVVVLLHGLGRTHLSLVVTQLLLRRAGYDPIGIFYPSRSGSIEELARYVRRRLPDRGDGRMHFLTHSLGGVVARHLLSADRPGNLGRVVMLAPPNQGSGLAGRLHEVELFRRLMGPAARQLGAGRERVAELLGPVDFELGVIIGDRPRVKLLERLAPGSSEGPGDGTVAVEEARVDGMADFLVVHRGHTFIMNDPKVVRQAAHFFEHGRFDRA